MTYLDNLVPWDKARIGLHWCAQSIGSMLLLLNNRKRNVGQVTISDREMKEECGFKSIKYVTQGKETLAKLGFIEFEGRKGIPTTYTLKFFSAKRGTLRGTLRGTPDEIPIYARARKNGRHEDKEKKNKKRKERSEILEPTTEERLTAGEVLRTLEKEKTESEPVTMIEPKPELTIEPELTIAVKEPKSEAELLAEDEAAGRAEFLAMVEQLKASDPALAAMMMSQYEATTTAQVETASAMIESYTVAATIKTSAQAELKLDEDPEFEDAPPVIDDDEDWTLEEPDFSAEIADYRAEIERECELGHEKVTGGIGATSASKEVGDSAEVRLDGQGNNRDDLPGGRGKRPLRKLRGRMYAKASRLSAGKNHAKSVACGMDGLSASAKIFGRAKPLPSSMVAGKVRGSKLGRLRIDDGQSACI